MGNIKKLKTDKSEEFDFVENQLNRLGYQLIQVDRTDDAIKIFRLNQEKFLESAKAYDSYGDGLLASGDTTSSLINFKKVLYDFDGKKYSLGLLNRIQGKTTHLLESIYDELKIRDPQIKPLPVLPSSSVDLEE